MYGVTTSLIITVSTEKRCLNGHRPLIITELKSRKYCNMVKISDFQGRSARANVEEAIAKARANESFNAVLSLTEERALERADLVDRGELNGRLAGVPFIAKDNFLTFAGKTTAASKILENFE